MRNAAHEAGSPVSRTVPSTKTDRMSFKVWYVFCATPQHIPEALFAMIPPIAALSMDAGSGPILYMMGCFVLTL